MKRVLLPLVALGVLAAAVFAALHFKGPAGEAGGGAGPRLAAALDGANTLFVLAFQLDDAPRRFTEVLASSGELLTAIPEAGKLREPAGRKELLGFDPGTPDGWRGIGLSTELEGGVVVDARLVTKKGAERTVVPALLFKVTDREKLRVWAEARLGGKIELGAGPVATVKVQGRLGLLCKRGAYDALVAPDLDDAAATELRPGFEAFCAGTGPSLAASADFKTALSDSPAGAQPTLGAFYVQLAAMGPLLDRLPEAPPQVRQALDYYRARFPAFASFGAPTRTGARLVATAEGGRLLAQLFPRDKNRTTFSQLLPKRGWAAYRFSAHLPTLWDGLAQLVPPGLGIDTARILEARNKLAEAFGTSWDEIQSAFGGQSVVAVDLNTVVPASMAGPGALGWIAALSVRDRAKLDGMLPRMLEHLAKQGEPAAQPVTVRGRKGYKLTIEGLTIVIAREQDLLLFAPSESALEVALERPTAETLRGAPVADALDGDVVVGQLVDTGPLVALARLAPGASMIGGGLFAALEKDPLLAYALRLDDHGLFYVGGGPGPFATIWGALVAGGVVGYMEAARGKADLSGPMGILPPGQAPAPQEEDDDEED